MANITEWRSLISKWRESIPSLNQIIKRIRQLQLVGWVMVGLSVIALMVIVEFVMQFSLPSTTNLSITRPERSPTPPALSQLAELHLLGYNVSGQDISSLPKTTLELDIKGIFSSPSPQMGSAIIATKDGPDHVYIVGDTLPGGAVLLDVYEDCVILKRAGQLEVLNLPQNFLPTQKPVEKKK